MSSYSGTFQYTQFTTDYNDLDSPFVNTDGSFTTLTKTTNVSGSNTIVSWTYVFNDSGNSSIDGLYLNGTITTPGNITIDDFDSIPMSRQGSQFKNYIGSFPLTSTNIPTLLVNTSCFEMFYGASNFNQDMGDWDTSTVTNMSYMFYNAYTFNKNISSKIANNGSDYLAWDTSNVTDMSYMFYRTGNATPLQSFNNSEANTFGIAGTKPLNWNTTNVVNMLRMFNYCAYFNQYIGTKYITITNGSTTYNYISCDVKNVTDMYRILDSAFNFNNGEIENSYTTPLRWNTVSVTTFERSFRKWILYSSYVNRYNQNMYSETIILEDSSTTYTSWDTSNVTTMYLMFENSIFNNGASSGSGDNPMNLVMTSNTKCQYMFKNCSDFNSPVNFTNTNNVTTFAYMFEDCVLFNQPINFNTTSTNQIDSMFARCSLFNQNIGSLNVTNLAINIGQIIESTNISITNFNKTLEGWASQSTPTSNMTVATNANYSSTGETYRNTLINTYGWTFTGGSLVSSSLFQYTLPTSDYVSSDEPIINTDSRFTTLQKSTEVSGSNTIVYRDFIFSDNGTTNDGLNLNAITTSTNMAVNDFNSIPLSRAGSSLLNYTGTVPSGLPTLLSNSSLTRMFEGATNYNQDVSTFDVSTVANFSATFKGASNFNQNLGSWDISSATDMSNMLDNTDLSIANYSDTLIGWNNLQNTPSNITLGASTSTYNDDGEAARTNLTNIQGTNWTISDSGLACVHESTDFLCYVDNEEKYINIKDIKPGFLVKTYEEGYVKVKHIFRQRCFNSTKNRMSKFFVMNKSKNDLLTKDLIITGGHSILVDELTEEQHNKMKSTGIKYLSIYDKYKLVTFFNEDFVGKTDESEERVYLLVLEADDDHKVYGAYVNGGMIIETCGIAMCKILKFL